MFASEIATPCRLVLVCVADTRTHTLVSGAETVVCHALVRVVCAPRVSAVSLLPACLPPSRHLDIFTCTNTRVFVVCARRWWGCGVAGGLTLWCASVSHVGG